jgi:hypothetical protein
VTLGFFKHHVILAHFCIMCINRTDCCMSGNKHAGLPVLHDTLLHMTSCTGGYACFVTCFLILSSDDTCSGDDISTFSSNAGKAVAKRMPCSCSAQPSTPLPHEQWFGSLDALQPACSGHADMATPVFAQGKLFTVMMKEQAYVTII